MDIVKDEVFVDRASDQQHWIERAEGEAGDGGFGGVVEAAY